MCAELRVDMPCIWRQHPSGGGAVIPAGCEVQHKIKYKQSLNLRNMYLSTCILNEKCID
jgi:hypothetical protein